MGLFGPCGRTVRPDFGIDGPPSRTVRSLWSDRPVPPIGPFSELYSLICIWFSRLPAHEVLSHVLVDHVIVVFSQAPLARIASCLDCEVGDLRADDEAALL